MTTNNYLPILILENTSIFQYFSMKFWIIKFSIDIRINCIKTISISIRRIKWYFSVPKYQSLEQTNVGTDDPIRASSFKNGSTNYIFIQFNTNISFIFSNFTVCIMLKSLIFLRFSRIYTIIFSILILFSLAYFLCNSKC